MHRELTEQLRELVFEEPLLALPSIDSCEDHPQIAGLICKGPVEVDKAAHRANRPINALKEGAIS